MSDDLFEVVEDQSVLARSTLLGSFITSGSQIAKIGLQTVSQIFLARLLFPEDFGLLAMATPIFAFVSVLNDLGFGQAIIQRDRLDRRHVSALFWLNLGLGALLGLILALLAPVFAHAYGEPRLTRIVVALAALIPLGALGILPWAVLARLMRFRQIAVAEILAVTVQTALSIGLAFAGFSYWSLVIGQAAASLVNVGVAWMFCPWRPGRARFDREIRGYVGFGASLTGANLATFASTSGDNIIIGLTNGERALGLYDRSYRLVLQPLSQCLMPINRVAVPLLSRLKHDATAYRRAYVSFIQAMLMLSLPGLAVCIMDAASVIGFVFGERWLAAVPIFSWVCLGGIASALYASTSWLFISQDRGASLLRFSIAASIINLVSFGIGTIWGVEGVAAVSAVSFILIQTPLMIFGATRTGFVTARDVVRALLPFLAALGVALAAVWVASHLLSAPLVVRLVSELLLAYAAFVAALCLSPHRRDYLESLRSLVSLARRRPDAAALPA